MREDIPNQNKTEQMDDDFLFNILKTIYESKGNSSIIRANYPLYDIIGVLGGATRLPDNTAQELIPIQQKTETETIKHLREYILLAQKGEWDDWQEPFLRFLLSCDFPEDEIRAVLNDRFELPEEIKEAFDAAARRIGMRAIFMNYGSS